MDGRRWRHVAFEVSGSPDAARLVTDVVQAWGTVSIIAIHAEPVPFRSTRSAREPQAAWQPALHPRGVGRSHPAGGDGSRGPSRRW
jgi:threonine dehydrogenase-like Zn-dependent dehydrogenase